MSVCLCVTLTRAQGLKQQTSDLLALLGRDKTHPEWSHLCCWKAEQTVHVRVCLSYSYATPLSPHFSLLLTSYPSTHWMNPGQHSFITSAAELFLFVLLRYDLCSYYKVKNKGFFDKWHARWRNHMVLTATVSAPVFQFLSFLWPDEDLLRVVMRTFIRIRAPPSMCECLRFWLEFSLI